MFSIEVAVPGSVLLTPLPDRVTPADFEGDEVPAAAALAWIEAEEVTAWSVAMLADIDPRRVPDADLAAFAAACQRMEASFAARKCDAIRRLADARTDPGGRNSFGAGEVAVALGMPHRAACDAVARARRLPGALPRTFELFGDGRLTERHVRVLLDLTSRMSIPACAELEDRLLGPLERAGARMPAVHHLAARARRLIAAIDPDALRRNHERAKDEADVTVAPDENAMAYLTAYMPVVDALIVKKAVDAYAANRKADGDPRPLGGIRAEALRVFAEGYLNGTLTGHTPTHHGRPVEIQITATPETLLGLTDTPGEIPGVAPVPAEAIRELAHEAKLRWLTINADTGMLLDYGDTTYRPSARTADAVKATYVSSVGPNSTVPADRTDLDHLIPHPDGATIPDNLAPIDRGWHRAKTHGGYQAQRLPDGRIRWTTPLGQEIDIQPYDYRLGP